MVGSVPCRLARDPEGHDKSASSVFVYEKESWEAYRKEYW